ncbi:MAG: uroporphyrinogen decarboxylase family protein [Actinomycetota bacterium]|nr:uroporphyrinogen decarboxylase family protein [Actinomycetota bacterium]
MSMYPRVGGRLLRPTSRMIELGSSLFALHGKVCELTPLERVLVAVFYKEPDRVPVIPFIIGAARRMTGASYRDFSLDPESAAEAYIEAIDIMGVDALYNILDLSVETAYFGQEVVYPPSSTPYPNYRNPVISSPEDCERLEVFDPQTSPRMGMAIEQAGILAKKARLRYPVMGFTFGPLGILVMIRGAQDLFLDCLKCPEKVKVDLEIVTEVLLDYVRAQCDRGWTR